MKNFVSINHENDINKTKGTLFMKKTISFLLALVMAIACLPVNAYAASCQETCAYSTYSSDASLLEITRDGAPIRTGPGKNYSTVVTCSSGMVLEKIGKKVNKYNNTWYQVSFSDYNTKMCYTGYIYSENTKSHSHQYKQFEYNGVTYKYCSCGKITVRAKTEVELKKADALALAGTAAGTLTLVDGPIPVGDIIGAALLVTAGLLEATGVIPTSSEVAEVFDDIDYEGYKEDGDSCPVDSYRRVSRAGGTLTFIDNQCLTIIEAYVWVRTGNDVWCADWDTAMKLGALHADGCFSEIDSGNKDYWYHFHLGSCTPEGRHQNIVGGHIFYGASAITHRYPV